MRASSYRAFVGLCVPELVIFEGMRALDHAQVLGGFAVVIISALMIDLTLGALQWLLSQDDGP